MALFKDAQVGQLIASYQDRKGERVHIIVGQRGNGMPVEHTMSFERARKMIRDPKTPEEQRLMAASVKGHYCNARGSVIETMVILAEIA